MYISIEYALLNLLNIPYYKKSCYPFSKSRKHETILKLCLYIPDEFHY